MVLDTHECGCSLVTGLSTWVLSLAAGNKQSGAEMDSKVESAAAAAGGWQDVLVCWCHHNKVPLTGWLKQKLIVFQFRRQEV